MPASTSAPSNRPSATGADTDPLRQVAVALDTADREQFSRWCAFFGPRVGVLKVGLQAFVSWGPDAVREAVGHARAVFLDLKLHDIPNTVRGAAAAVRDLGVRYLTVHASGGPSMLRAAAEGAGDGVAVLAVTVLTHLDQEELGRLDMPGTAADRAAVWAELAAESGCGGAVCSPLELPRLRPLVPSSFRLVTPGIRPASAGADDQRRTARPAQAVQEGADLLVIGRPLTQAAEPERALEALGSELSAART